MFLDYLRENDQRPDYREHVLSPDERELVELCLSRLSSYHLRVMRERLIRIVFIDGLIGNGWTDWVLDSRTNVFTVMAINSQVLHESASELLTKKDMTAFSPDGSGFSVAWDAGDAPGLMYILAHEATHAADYVHFITPFTEKTLGRVLNLTPQYTPFVLGVWDKHDLPLPGADFPQRKRVTFYGIAGGPKLKAAEIPAVYDELSRSCFVSLYASLNWAEDLAETVAFHQLAQELDYPVRLIVLSNGRTNAVYEPEKNPRVRERYEAIRRFSDGRFKRKDP